MQLSQFDKDATLDEDGKVSVSGAVAAETDEHGNVVPRRSTVRFHFLIVQGEPRPQGRVDLQGGPLDRHHRGRGRPQPGARGGHRTGGRGQEEADADLPELDLDRRRSPCAR